MLSRLMREPVLHFLVLGALIFAAFFALEGPAPEGNKTEIVIDSQIAERLVAQFQASWRRYPSPSELDAFIDTYLREEILVREALALSLDRGDAVIRQRLQQKMTFIAKSAAAAVTVDDAEVETFFEENSARYVEESALAFMQVYLGSAPTDADIARALEDLQSGRDPSALGTRILLPLSFPLASQQKIDGTLGPGVYAALEELEMGVWGGPIQTGYGLHLVQLTERRPPAVPSLDTVRDIVERDWRASVEEKLTAAQFDQMRVRYTVERPSLEEIEAILK